MMTFEQFQNRARLYVLGALEPEEVKEIEEGSERFGQKAQDFIQECDVLHEAFALILRPARSSALLKERLMSMVRDHAQC